MFDVRSVPDFFHSITFENGVSVEFNEESTIMFYNQDSDEPIMMLDPSDLSTIYAAYRMLVKERLEESCWRSVK